MVESQNVEVASTAEDTHSLQSEEADGKKKWNVNRSRPG